VSRIDEITGNITPEQWLQGLRQNRAAYEEQLVQLVTDRAIVQSSSRFKDKELVVARFEEQILEIDARITEIDKRLEAAAKGAMGKEESA